MGNINYRLANYSIGLGVTNLTMCFFPVIGMVLSVIGLLLGIVGIKKSEKILSISGAIICVFGILLAIFVEIQSVQNQSYPLKKILNFNIALLLIFSLVGFVLLIKGNRTQSIKIYKFGQVLTVSSLINLGIILGFIIPLFGFLNAI